MIFISGVAGFVGLHMAKFLVNRGESVFGFDLDEHCPSFMASDLKYRCGKVEDPSIINEVFDQNTFDHILHLGMTSTPAQVNTDPVAARESIVTGTKNLLRKAIESEAKSFIFFSSSHVYGDVNLESISEDSRCMPKSNYGKLKLEAEELCLSMAKGTATKVHIVRPTSLYGPNDPSKRVVTKFIEKACKGEEIEVNDLTSKLDFTYIDDFIEGIHLLLKSSLSSNEIFNLSRGEGRTLVELTNILKEDYPDLHVNLNEKVINTKKGCLDITKAKQQLNYNPQTDLELGIKKILSQGQFQ